MWYKVPPNLNIATNDSLESAKLENPLVLTMLVSIPFTTQLTTHGFAETEGGFKIMQT